MARTDDDSWDITEGVGATALGVALARSQEAASECPLMGAPSNGYAMRSSSRNRFPAERELVLEMSTKSRT